MGIDVTKLRKAVKQDAGGDDLSKILDEVYGDAEKGESVLDSERESTGIKQGQVAVPKDSLRDEGDGGGRRQPKTDGIPGDDAFVGRMLYDNHPVEVSEQVDRDGNVWVRDDKGLLQVKASDLKAMPEVTDVSKAGKNPDAEWDEGKRGGWDSYVGDMVERIGAGTAAFGGSMYSLADKLEGWLGKTNPILGAGRKLMEWNYERKHPGERYRSWLERQADDAYQYAQVLRGRSDRYAGKDYAQLWDEGDYGGMVGEVFLTASESLPQSAVAMMGGGAGLALTGATAGTQRYDELDKMPEFKDMPEGMKVINAFATGCFEALFEKLGDEIVGESLKRIYKLKGVQQAEKQVRDEVTAWMSKMSKKYGVFWMPVAEGVEEFATQVADNVTDYCTGATDEWKPLDGALDSFVYGAAGGMQFAAVGAPGAVVNFVDKKVAQRDFRRAKENVRRAFSGDAGVETFVGGIPFMTPAEQEAVLGSMARSGAYTDEQVESAIDFARVANRNREYRTPEAQEKEQAEREELLIQTDVMNFKQELSDVVNEAGNVQEVKLEGEHEQSVYIVKGDVAVVEEGGEVRVDVDRSSPELYYMDREGKMQVVTPHGIGEVVQISRFDDLVSDFEAGLRVQWEDWKNNLSVDNGDVGGEQVAGVEAGKFPDGIVPVNNGDVVVYENAQGEQVEGVVADAFSDAEHVFLSDGTPVVRERIKRIKEVGTDEVAEQGEERVLPDQEQKSVSPDERKPDEALEDSGVEQDAEGVLPDEKANPRKSYEIDEGITAVEQEDGSYLLNQEFSRSNLEKGKKLVERLNKDFDDRGIRYELVELPKADALNKFEKTKWGVVAREVENKLPEKQVVVSDVRREGRSEAKGSKRKADHRDDEHRRPEKEVIEEQIPENLTEEAEVEGADDVGVESEEHDFGTDHALVSRERFEELKRKWRDKTGGRSNVGSDSAIGEVSEKLPKEVEEQVRTPEEPRAKEQGTDEQVAEDLKEDLIEEGNVGIADDAGVKREKHDFGAGNVLVSRERCEELKRKWREKTRGQLNVGFDPELLAIGTELAAFYIEAGARKFRDFAESIVADLGDSVTPYLKAIYEGARYMPGMEKVADDMDDSNFIATFQVDELFQRNGGKGSGTGRQTAEEAVKNRVGDSVLGNEIFPVKTYSIEGIDHEIPSKEITKQVKRDVDKFVKALQAYLGWEFDTDRRGKQVICQANIAPAGGDASFRLWQPDSDVGVWVRVNYEPPINNFDRFIPIKEFWLRVERRSKSISEAGRNLRFPSACTVSELAGKFEEVVEEYQNERKGKEQKNIIEHGQDNRSVSDTGGKGVVESDAGSDANGNVPDVPRGQVEGVFERTGRSGVGGEREGGSRRTEQAGIDGSDERGGSVSVEGDAGGAGRTIDGETDRGDRGVSGNRSSVKNSRNYVIRDVGRIVPAGEISKIKANIEAIRLLKQLEQEGRTATREEQEVFAQFSGWGGLADVLNKKKKYDNNWVQKYGRYHAELVELLTEDEFRDAVHSTINAHYTSGEVGQGLWQLAERLGFRGGRVLEPCAGIGNLLGLMPAFLTAQSDILAYELDSLSGRMLSHLYPDADVKVTGYENSKDRDIDLIVTNVPFGKIAPHDKVNKDIRSFSLHNYFIAKGIKQLRPGGLGIFITSMSTMDGGSSAKFREWVTKEGNADLVGAIRLPNNAFTKNAGTEVTTDILVFRKRTSDSASPFAHSFRYAVPIQEAVSKAGEKVIIDVNEYFAQNPAMMLGDVMLAHEAGSGTLYSGDRVTLKAREGEDLNHALQVAIGQFDRNVMEVTESRQSRNTLLAKEGDREGTLILRDGDLRIVENGELVVPGWIDEYTTDNRNKRVRRSEVAKKYLFIRDAINALVDAEVKDTDDIEELRVALNREYDDFVGRFGEFYNNAKLRFLTDSDVSYNTVFSLEQVEVKHVKGEDGKVRKAYEVSKAAIFKKRVSFPVAEPQHAKSAEDALNICIAYRGGIEIPFIASLLDLTEQEAEKELLATHLAFVNPVSGLLEDRDSYLSGFVRKKLAEAKEAAESDISFSRNVDALLAVQPLDILPSQIRFRLGSPFIPSAYIEQFAKDYLHVDAHIQYEPAINRWTVDVRSGFSNPQNKTVHGTQRAAGSYLLERAINLAQPVVWDTFSEGGKKVQRKNLEETLAAQAKMFELQDDFVNYISDNEAYMTEIARVYNEEYNGFVEKKYSEPVFLHYPGANPAITLRVHQRKAVSRALKECVLLGHQVGSGKTFTMITTAMEMRRLGLAKKPMVVVQNSTVGQFVASFKLLYPAAKVLAPTKRQTDAQNRTRLLNLISYGDFDAIIIPQSFLSMIPDQPSRLRAYINEEIAELESMLLEVNSNEDKSLYSQLNSKLKDLRGKLLKLDKKNEDAEAGGEEEAKGVRVKDQARKELGIVKRLHRQADRKVDEVRTFEQLGVDALFVDEAHAFKRLGFTTKLATIKGIDISGSQRAFSLLMKVRYIQQITDGRNVIFATGTPISNTMAEAWTMMKYIAPDVLEQYSIERFDEFASIFGSIEPSLEFTAAGSFKSVDRFKSYVNTPEFLQAFRACVDVVLTEDIAEFQDGKTIPQLKGGGFTQKIIPQSEWLQQVMADLKDVLKRWENLSPKEKKEKRHIPLVVFNRAKQAAIDLRLLDSDYPDDPGSKTNVVVTEVLRIYQETQGFKGTQLVFSDMYQSPDIQGKQRFNLYKDIEAKLVAGGIPASEIAIINDYTDSKRELLFTQVQNGEVRVLLGSTEKMGVGVNVQNRLAALHHIDAPARPMDFEQRNGRILRQGNFLVEWGVPVEVLTYGVEKTLDATAYQRLAIKQKFINQLMKGENLGRSVEDFAGEDAATDMSFDQMMATLSGSQYAILHTQKVYELKRLLTMKKNHERRLMEMDRLLRRALYDRQEIQAEEKVLEDRRAAAEKYFGDNKIFKVSIGGNVFTEKLGDALSEAILAFLKKCKRNLDTDLVLSVYINEHPEPVNLRLYSTMLEGKLRYHFALGGQHDREGVDSVVSTGAGLISSLISKVTVESVEADFEVLKERGAMIEEKIPVYEEELKKQFDKEEQLQKLDKEVNELEKKMEAEVIDDKGKGKLPEAIIEGDEGEKGVVDEEVMFREGVRSWRFAERERVRREVERLSRELGVEVKTLRDRSELPKRVQGRMSDERRYPGVFLPRTHEAFVILNEVTDAEDLRRSVYHEYVGHQGMRGLLGDRFPAFCKDVLASLSPDVRQKLLKDCRGDRQRAAEEYVASFAEGYRDPTAWMKVKAFLKRAFRAVGIDLRFSDADLMFLLWRSKNRLKDRGVMALADVYGREAVLFRENEFDLTYEGVSEVVIEDKEMMKLHNEVASSKFQFVEAYQDRMLSVKRLQELYEQKLGKLPDYMNAYLFENTLASRNRYEMEFFRNNYLRGLTQAIAVLENAGLSRREVENYVLLKHGLERNEYIRNKKLDEVLIPAYARLEAMKGVITEEEYDEEEMRLIESEERLRKRLWNTDFAGVKVVAEEVENGDIEGYISRMEDSYAGEIEALWKSIHAATDFSLKKWYESGMMNRKGYEKVKGMFKYYVPLRGFDETIAEDVYEYFLKPNGNFTNPMRKMNGRRSRADNPFAFIVSQAESAVVGGNKNLLKLHLFRLGQKYPSPLMSVNKVWYEQVGENEEGEPIFEAAIPTYDADAEVYRRNVEDFRERMQQLAAAGKAYESRSGLRVGLRTLGNEAEEHVVRVKLNGDEFALYVHGDPRPAQAVNGLNDQERVDNRIVQAIQRMNRQLAANFTTRNPAFVVSNLCRDFIFSCSTLSVKEGARYRNRFVKHIPEASQAIMRYLTHHADLKQDADVLFQEFLKHGGETGFTALYSIEKYKRMVDREVENTRRGRIHNSALRVLDFFEAGNRWAEDLSRFSVYLTSRRMGRSVLQSVNDAKEVTVNFNRKGSGAKGAQVFRSLYLFFNAAVQSLANFSELFRKHPKRTAVLVASYASMGMLIPMLLMLTGGDDALEEYLNLPDYIRKNNVCFWLGKQHGFVTIPLPIELRAFNGLGDAAFRYLSGEIGGKSAASEVLAGFADLLPLNPVGGDTPFIPDAVKPVAQSFYTNKDFTGRPIARVTPFNRYDPEYRRVYKGTGEFFVGSSAVLNDWLGGDYATRGYVDRFGGAVSNALNMEVALTNPAAVEHLFEAYLGGLFTTVNQGLKTLEGGYKAVVNGDSGLEARHLPVVNRFYYSGGMWGMRAKVNARYFEALDELRELESRMRKYKEGMRNGLMDVDAAMKAYAELVEDGSYERMQVIRFYSNEVDRIRQELGRGLSEDEVEELQEEELLLKRQMLDELRELKRKGNGR